VTKDNEGPSALQIMDCQEVTTKKIVCEQHVTNDTSSLSGAADECIDQPSLKIGSDDKSHKYGMKVARELRAMSEKDQAKAKLDINAVLYKIKYISCIK